MNVGTGIFGPQFGAYSFKSYVPILAAIIVAAVVGEIAHNAKVKRRRRQQARKITKMRQLVQKQRMRRDLALLEAEKQAKTEMRRRAIAYRLLFLPETSEYRIRPVLQNKSRTPNDIVKDVPLESYFDSPDHPKTSGSHKRGPLPKKRSSKLSTPSISRHPKGFSSPITAEVSDEEEDVLSNAEEETSSKEFVLRSTSTGRESDVVATPMAKQEKTHETVMEKETQVESREINKNNGLSQGKDGAPKKLEKTPRLITGKTARESSGQKKKK